jgi:hypothetical protein
MVNLLILKRYFDFCYLWYFSLFMHFKDSNLSSNKNLYNQEVIRWKRIIRKDWLAFSDFSKDCNMEYIICNLYHRSRKYHVEKSFTQYLKHVITNEKIIYFLNSISCVILLFNNETNKNNILNFNIEWNILVTCFNNNFSDLNFKSIFHSNMKLIDVWNQSLKIMTYLFISWILKIFYLEEWSSFIKLDWWSFYWSYSKS